MSDAKPTTGFRKWVTTILSTTCVAQNVVLLALLFIHRLKKYNPSVRGKPGSEYRLLTVALMLGNKFLDDNTYTNKTWAEVSGINVAEVHIMEVEFLSNMKYCLFTSEQDWSNWQTLLGKFSVFFDRASKPQPPAPILPPASSLHLPMALPSPPISQQASPPYVGEVVQNTPVYATSLHQGLTPAPSPSCVSGEPVAQPSQPGSRKRSLEEYVEPPRKRVASGYQSYSSPQRLPAIPAQNVQGQTLPRLPLPSLTIPTSQLSELPMYQPSSQGQQLPPLGPSVRTMPVVYSNAHSQNQGIQPVVPPAASTQPQQSLCQQYQTRLHSPYRDSTTVSPTSALPQGAAVLQPPHQVSPSYYLEQRSSPYRPIHHVSTLLYPPPSATMLSRPQQVELNQMHYQPLGKQQRQSGRLPYVAQNIWVDGNHPQEMTPVHQWPGFKVPPQAATMPR